MVASTGIVGKVLSCISGGAPIFTCLILCQLALFQIWKLLMGIGIQSMVLCAGPVIFLGEYSRLIFSPFFHTSYLHSFIVNSLFLHYGSKVEHSLGSITFLGVVFKFIVITNLFYVLAQWLLYTVTGDLDLLVTCSLGMSGVVSGLAVVRASLSSLPDDSFLQSVHHNDDAWKFEAHGPHTQAIAMPILMVILLQLALPNVSFTHHLCGIVVGYLYTRGVFKIFSFRRKDLIDWEEIGWLSALRTALSSSNSVVYVDTPFESPLSKLAPSGLAFVCSSPPLSPRSRTKAGFSRAMPDSPTSCSVDTCDTNTIKAVGSDCLNGCFSSCNKGQEGETGQTNDRGSSSRASKREYTRVGVQDVDSNLADLADFAEYIKGPQSPSFADGGKAKKIRAGKRGSRASLAEDPYADDDDSDDDDDYDDDDDDDDTDHDHDDNDEDYDLVERDPTKTQSSDAGLQGKHKKKKKKKKKKKRKSKSPGKHPRAASFDDGEGNESIIDLGVDLNADNDNVLELGSLDDQLLQLGKELQLDLQDQHNDHEGDEDMEIDVQLALDMDDQTKW